MLYLVTITFKLVLRDLQGNTWSTDYYIRKKRNGMQTRFCKKAGFFCAKKAANILKDIKEE
ncbi:MAG: hypothetical protein A2Y03_03385 [Omnitrophica WOR_2 bacterium GWF2_38_59]|nr:MAG: hypothetical protein A2Y06_02010 [Omnitrophica WOR_2 bacterium GWA2_37_7]OGX24505.1 MAG: hypothetical protein A2Y03_03385 [Omnitrophica WOR_2 bacterium GWF2_38_59]OGX50290.1 MAG: hypothetical protein A2243_07280 [Omnitrophica WOR_2 bacterium RIFOXYA2_FULL_38_17]OGX54409.1 MAG: hypothetical protein A2267_01070 [Omnitrophica WOR_2 bacterium RIFOXYA12_FULL_38_10]OGX54947.1 MAG: hypothetical protein A2447_08780 [Omnitrophica WOR_2 bacterium RIFOXYC2_FULL_38_12]OGX60537.1 MAG: hypothetical 